MNLSVVIFFGGEFFLKEVSRGILVVEGLRCKYSCLGIVVVVNCRLLRF